MRTTRGTYYDLNSRASHDSKDDIEKTLTRGKKITEGWLDRAIEKDLPNIADSKRSDLAKNKGEEKDTKKKI